MHFYVYYVRDALFISCSSLMTAAASALFSLSNEKCTDVRTKVKNSQGNLYLSACQSSFSASMPDAGCDQKRMSRFCSTRSLSSLRTSAIAQPPQLQKKATISAAPISALAHPAPVSRAPTQPAASARSTSESSSGQLHSEMREIIARVRSIRTRALTVEIATTCVTCVHYAAHFVDVAVAARVLKRFDTRRLFDDLKS